MKSTLNILFSIAAPLATLLALSGCDAVLGSVKPGSGAGASSPTITTVANGALSSGSSDLIGGTCTSSDPNHICLALHYVVYEDANNAPVADAGTVANDMKTINSVWSNCNIGFEITHFETVQPTSKGLGFGLASANQLEQIRAAYKDPTESTLLAVSVGPWNTQADAWTNMPGSGTYGIVLDQNVASYPWVIAHELGHYLNLDHVSDQSNLMNPVIYANSSLNQSQCDAARSTALSYWSKMRRY